MAKRKVLFLGAGASVPFGYPTTDRLLSEIWTQLNNGDWWNWSQLSNRRAKADATALRALLRAILPGLRRGASGVAGASITDVLSFVDHLLLEGKTPGPAWKEERLRRARWYLAKAINGVLQGRRNLPLRKRLAEWILAQEKQGNRITIVSTNYDTTIEQPLYNELRARGRKVEESVDFGVAWRDPKGSLPLHPRPADARLVVLKMHGSLNWLRCQWCGHVYINCKGRIASLDMDRTTPYNTCICTGRLRMITVTPSFVRDVRDANLLSIWNVAFEELRRADEWLLIGYSLPVEDLVIRSILLRAFRTARKHLRVRVSQLEDPGKPDPEGGWPVRLRYQLFFPKGSLVEYRADGAEAFLTDLVDSGRAGRRGDRGTRPRRTGRP